MTISAPNGIEEAVRLSQSLELYRELTVALRERISNLKSGSTGDAYCRQSVEMVRAHYKALRTVIDLEDSIAEQKPVGTEEPINESDLDAARAEIASRLSVWAASKRD
jgi:hypothetical protein